MSLYRQVFDRGLTRVDAETAHRWGFRAVQAGAPLLRARAMVKPYGEPVEALGLTFGNRLGLAAGFDKNADGITALGLLGFGHVEIGTVTALAQPGNPKPRLFRLPEDRAVVNRMGFNNDGAHAVAPRLKLFRTLTNRTMEQSRPGASLPRTVLGVNIGKSKVVPDDDQAAVEADYETSAGLLAPYADYLVVNVSSPNTPGLRNLQAVEKLEPLLHAVRRRADQVTGDRRVPMLVKIAPDLADEDVDGVADLARAIGLDGIIATNTTISREGLASSPSAVEAVGAGGLSGQPLTQRSLEVLRRLKAHVGDDLTLIGVGGISTVAQARARLDAGATLIQGYSAFIYEGPNWPRRIVRGLEEAR